MEIRSARHAFVLRDFNFIGFFYLQFSVGDYSLTLESERKKKKNKKKTRRRTKTSLFLLLSVWEKSQVDRSLSLTALVLCANLCRRCTWQIIPLEKKLSSLRLSRRADGDAFASRTNRDVNVCEKSRATSMPKTATKWKFWRSLFFIFLFFFYICLNTHTFSRSARIERRSVAPTIEIYCFYASICTIFFLQTEKLIEIGQVSIECFVCFLLSWSISFSINLTFCLCFI